MNAMTVSFVLVRLAAAFLFVRGVQGLSSYSYLLTGDAPAPNFAIVTLVFGVILPIGIAIVLWLHPEKVTGAQIVSAKADEAVSASAILMIGITLLGLYVFVYGVVDLFYIEAVRIAQSRATDEMNLPNDVMHAQAFAGRITNVVKIVLGVCLILGRNGLTRLFLKAKYGGLAVTQPKD
jgi:hypothetical protein